MTLDRDYRVPGISDLAIAELVQTLAAPFDVAVVMHRIAEAARDGFASHSAAVVLLDSPSTSRAHASVVADSTSGEQAGDPTLYTSGPGLTAANDGAVTMIADLDDIAADRWPRYCEYARGAGLRSVRAFPIKAFSRSVGSVVVPTNDLWGTKRPPLYGQVLADLAAVALSMGQIDGRRAAVDVTIAAVLDEGRWIATAIGIVCEWRGLDAGPARALIGRLARGHGRAFTAHCRVIVAAHMAFRNDPNVGGTLVMPPVPPLPRTFDS